jgi:hypothetical protein
MTEDELSGFIRMPLSGRLAENLSKYIFLQIDSGVIQQLGLFVLLSNELLYLGSWKQLGISAKEVPAIERGCNMCSISPRGSWVHVGFSCGKLHQ